MEVVYMDLLKIPKEPIIIENQDFQTIQIHVLFPFEEKEADLAKMTLLPTMLMYMNQQYPTEREFQKELKRRYILGASGGRAVIGTTGFFRFQFHIPDSFALGNDMLETQLEFLGQILYHPKIVNHGFDPFEVEREKKSLQIRIQNNRKSLGTYQSIRLPELVDTEGFFSRCIENHIELIDDVSPYNLYQYYVDRILSCQPLIIVMGNVKKEKIIPLIKKYLYYISPVEQCIPIHYNCFLTPTRKIPQEIIETKSFQNSSLSLVYKIKDLKDVDRPYLELVRSLLISLSSRLLDKKLRDEYDLIYSSQVINYFRFGVFEITVFIHRSKKDLAKEKILEVMEDLKNEKLIEPFLDNIKERRKITMIEKLDDKYALLRDQEMQILQLDISPQERFEQIKKITARDISNFLRRFVLDTIYFIKENEHE